MRDAGFERGLRTASLVLATMLALGAAACGGGSESAASGERPFLDGLAKVPDLPSLRKHLLVADLERLRRAYSDSSEARAALVGVWLPDAL